MKTKVIVLKLKGGSLKYGPRGFHRLSAWERGVVVNHAQIGRVAFEEIRALSAFVSNEKEQKRTLLLLFLEGQARPFMIDAFKIDYNDFPMTKSDAVVANFRKWLMWMCKKCPELVIDRGTYDFLTGKPPQTLYQDTLNLATAVALALQPDSVEEPTAPVPQTGDMVCPKCHYQQPPATECVQCGVVVQKYLELQKKKAAQLAPKQGTDRPATQPPAGATQTPRMPPAVDRDPQPDADETATETGAEPKTAWEAAYVEDRFLSVDIIFKRALALVTAHFWRLLCVLLAIMGGSVILYLGLLLLARIHLVLYTGFSFVAALFIYSYYLVAVLYFLDNAVERDRRDILEALVEGFKKTPGAVINRLGATLLALLGLLCFVVPGIVYGIRFLFVEVDGAVRHNPARLVSHLQVSRNLARGYHLTIAAYFLMVVIMIALLFYGVFFGWTLLAAVSGSSGSNFLALVVLGVPVIILVSAFCFFLFAAVLYLMYSELKSIHGERSYQLADGIDPLTRMVLAIDAFIFIFVVLKLMF